jgi:hypothetical protein
MSDGLTPGKEAVFDPARFIPQFSDVHIVGHLTRVVRLVEELDPPADLRTHVFNVVQAMCSAMSPVEGSTVEVANGAMAPALKLRR